VITPVYSNLRRFREAETRNCDPSYGRRASGSYSDSGHGVPCAHSPAQGMTWPGEPASIIRFPAALELKARFNLKFFRCPVGVALVLIHGLKVPGNTAGRLVLVGPRTIHPVQRS
jgi:hypothetical protein